MIQNTFRPAEAHLRRVTEIVARWAGHEFEAGEAIGRVMDVLEEAGELDFVVAEPPANDA